MRPSRVILLTSSSHRSCRLPSMLTSSISLLTSVGIGSTSSMTGLAHSKKLSCSRLTSCTWPVKFVSSVFIRSPPNDWSKRCSSSSRRATDEFRWLCRRSKLSRMDLDLLSISASCFGSGVALSSDRPCLSTFFITALSSLVWRIVRCSTTRSFALTTSKFCFWATVVPVTTSMECSKDRRSSRICWHSDSSTSLTLLTPASWAPTFGENSSKLKVAERRFSSFATTSSELTTLDTGASAWGSTSAATSASVMAWSRSA
mmetsp:Transcript_40315/g.93448  ORF Transcript_40315/g.93448 Transcript_40315/m.93448 type:complete len:259 (+) Transcript_40315:652-1428(+)